MQRLAVLFAIVALLLAGCGAPAPAAESIGTGAESVVTVFKAPT